MSLIEMQDAVLLKLGLPSTSISAQAKNRITGYLNENQKGIAERTNWRSLAASGAFSTSNGVETYDLALDLIGSHGLEQMFNVTSNSEIIPKSDRWWRGRKGFSESGSPQYYRTFGLSSSNNIQVQLKGVPDGVYQVDYEYYAYPSKLVNSTDTTPFSEDMMVLAAYADYLKYDKDLGWMAIQNEFKAMLDSAVSRNEDQGAEFRMGGVNEGLLDDPPRYPYPYNS